MPLGRGSPNRAHPRSRGENVSSARSRSQHARSSPLARGKPCWPLPRPTLAGLIPARAGKTVIRSRTGPQRRAHPRSRGENGRRRGGLYQQKGSSPLARGKQRREIEVRLGVRLIPARAGKTCTRTPCVRRQGTHPRSRGENLLVVLAFVVVVGSSPLARGKPQERARRARSVRLIPARAGKTRMSCVVIDSHRAHPRSRGENVSGARRGLGGVGSSPLARGKRSIPNACSH